MAATPSGTASAVAIKTPEDFARVFLGAIGAPVTANNLTTVVGWEASEGGHWLNHAWYNPLNTTLVMPGSGPINGDPSQNNGHPVQAYPDLSLIHI